MKLSDLKYLAAFIAPALAYIGLFKGGYWSYGVSIFAFAFVPIVEAFLTPSTENLTEEETSSKLSSYFFDGLLLINIPIIFSLAIIFGLNYSAGAYSTFETIGLVLGLGTSFAASGINVAHELGHRKSKTYQFLAKVLLVPSLYMHFWIEHNRGHHKHVSTPLDPASSCKNEPIYKFFFRSIIKGYINAWALESKRLGANKSILSNEMVIYSIVTMLYLLSLYLLFGLTSMLLLIVIAVLSILHLETINYVEHYGLRRKLLDNGKYERVLPIHSWNSNHVLGRIILYELTRHSDHHYLGSKEFQILDHHDKSPQLILGYPGSMIISLFPPLWFKVMNDRIPV